MSADDRHVTRAVICKLMGPPPGRFFHNQPSATTLSMAQPQVAQQTGFEQTLAAYAGSFRPHNQ